MQQQITLNGKNLRITLSRAAQQALTQREVPLLVEMELYFSCLIRKQVRFHDRPASDDAIQLENGLSVRFHPVMSQGCSVDDNQDGPPMTDFPIVAAERFSPQWLTIHYRNGRWQGEFGY